MPIPLIVPILAAGLGAASPFIARAIAGKKPTRPDAPDLVAPILAELANRRSEAERDLQFRNIRDIEATRASGVNSVVAAGFRNQTTNEANDLRRRIDSIIADRISDAERQQQMLNFELEQAKFADRTNDYNARAQAISNALSSVSSGLFSFASGGIPIPGLGGGATAAGQANPYASLLTGSKIGLTSGSTPSVFNYQTPTLSTQLNNQLYAGGANTTYTPPTLTYPNSLNGGVPKSSLFQFQDRNTFSNQFRF